MSGEKATAIVTVPCSPELAFEPKLGGRLRVYQVGRITVPALASYDKVGGLPVGSSLGITSPSLGLTPPELAAAFGIP